MRYSRSSHFVTLMALVAILACIPAWAQKNDYSGIGRPPTAEELQAGIRGSGPSGKDLPPGKGTAKEGERVYLAKCAMCHGKDGEGSLPKAGSGSFFRGPRLSGGEGVPLWPSPNSPAHIVTFTTFVAYPTSLWNTISIYMPMFRPGSLTNDDVYGVTAFLLYKNGVIKDENAVMDRETLPKVEMPNRHGMIPENLEDVPNIEKRGCYKTYGVCP